MSLSYNIDKSLQMANNKTQNHEASKGIDLQGFPVGLKKCFLWIELMTD